MPLDRRPSGASIVAGIGSEFLREAAVLIAVFAPLDRILENGPLTPRFVLGTIGAVAVLLAGGIVLELKRQ
ncbi:MAG: hypothetical protein A3H97_02715 [Acidobacteria bacterium RIFCSPLOWO2_02_FULL_65_29]|nr:MAG: hypothetical protein A3H97_02715 [Acidobacteria bacterium RIFCSPLOWO2_02_FULL_65_29]